MGLLRGSLMHATYSQLLQAHKHLRTVAVRCLHQSANAKASSVRPWSSKEVRRTFIEYFQSHDHRFVPSSSVLPKRGEGTYFINAGMNQFKPVFLGTIDSNTEMATYERVVNSQKCIRVGGKHNDLEDVGKDTYHHTFFEMLGNWSFGNYFKREACEMAWKLMTEVYKIPASSLYVSYFGGDQQLGLEPDLESRQIWLEIGVPKDHILAFGMADNFWEMGETGPCGPCTEIHYAHGGRPDAAHLVNSGSTEVVELWNLVFMQYDRRADGSLKPLPRRHVDTGMGLERLTAALQGQSSNYETDLFRPIFSAIQDQCKIPYQGRVGAADNDGTDAAYRTIADHIRMVTVAIADGLRPGKLENERKLGYVLRRCMKQGQTVLGIPPTSMSGLVPIVVDILGDHFPEVQKNASEVCDVIDNSAHRYLERRQIGMNTLKKALNKYGDVRHLTGDQIWELQEGRFGHPVTIETLQDLASDFYVTLDVDAYKEKFASMKASHVKQTEAGDEQHKKFDQHDIVYISEKGIPPTDDQHKYRDSDALHLTARVCLLHVDGQFIEEVESGNEVGLLLDQTCFYSESGGQVADRGTITTSNGCIISVKGVQSTQGYVLHSGIVEEGKVTVNDEVQLVVNQEWRKGCTSNHSATHLINHALERLFGKVKQQGSLVMPDYLSFGFTCKQETLSLKDIQCVEDMVNAIISYQLPVDKRTVPLSRVRHVEGIRMLTDEVYPNDVRVISVGAAIDALLADDGNLLVQDHSVELCGGTHVNNTGELGCMVITNLTGSRRGTKRLTAVTGDLAMKVSQRGKELKSQFRELVIAVRTQDSKKAVQLTESIEKMLGEELLSKVDRDTTRAALDKLAESGLAEQKNLNTKLNYIKRLEILLETSAHQKFVVDKFRFGKIRDIVDAIATITPDKPVLLLSRADQHPNKILGVSYVPEGYPNGLTSEAWARHVSSYMKNGQQGVPKGKYAKRAPTVRTIMFESDKHLHLNHAVHLARTFADLYIS